jgi:hypothetical protein
MPGSVKIVRIAGTTIRIMSHTYCYGCGGD